MKRTNRAFVFSLSALAGVALLFGVSQLIFVDADERFPLLEKGFYVGSATGGSLSVNSEIPLFAASLQGERRLLVFMISPDWKAQVVSLVEKDREQQWGYPIRLDGPRSVLQLSGEKQQDGSFAGHFVDTTSQEEGVWNLSKIALPDLRDAEKANHSSLVVRMELIREMLRQLEKLGLEKARLELLQFESDRLRDALTDTTLVAQSRKVEGEEIGNEHKRLSDELTALRRETQELYQRLTIAQSITPMGKLVSLSREAESREQQWLEMQRRSAREARLNADLKQELERSNQVRQLQEQIRFEREAIRNLRRGER